MTKLREIIGSSKNFLYNTIEYVINYNGTVDKKNSTVNCSQTSMRFGENLRYEILIKDTYFIISEEDFNRKLHSKPVVIIRRKSEPTAITRSMQDPLLNKITPTRHFIQRAAERFNVPPSNVMGFISNLLKDHFIVQNYHFYNYGYKKYSPEDVVICSKDFKTVVVIAKDKGALTLVTCWDPHSDGNSHFMNWFQDHMDKIDKLPTLQQFYTGLF